MGNVPISWRFARFDELSPLEVHAIFRVRIEVFVIEQACPFQDVDGADPASWHLLGSDGGDPLAAYCRIIPPGIKYPEPSIGRVVTAGRVRRVGLGRELMREALRRTDELWPEQLVRIGAQARLERFYNEFGFARASDEYIEDGIPHIEMLRKAEMT